MARGFGGNRGFMTVEERVVELGLGGGDEMEGFGWVVGVDFQMGGHFCGNQGRGLLGERDSYEARPTSKTSAFSSPPSSPSTSSSATTPTLLLPSSSPHPSTPLPHHPPPPPLLRRRLLSLPPQRTSYLRLWYRPNSTRTFIFLDRPPPTPLPPSPQLSSPLPPPPSHTPSPPAPARRYESPESSKKSSSETSPKCGGSSSVTTTPSFSPHNLVRTLAKYDHDRWFYVGSGSESYEQNAKNSFGMAFGGGGFAISHSLARALARVLDSCLLRYPHLYGSDARENNEEVGWMTLEIVGNWVFHFIIDVRGDIFGMLSAHPLSPLLSLHHVDVVDPIFPSMTRAQALEHLFKAVNVDPGRVLQQTFCYDRANSLTVSVAWGYAIQVFEGNHFLPDLLQLQKTFRPWRRNRNIFSSLYMFNTREYPNDPCKRPVVFFLESVASGLSKVWTDYTRHIVGNCSRTMAVNNLEQIRVFSPKLDFDIGEVKDLRRQCCDILPSVSRSMVINIRQCGVDELISMKT
ncbi:glycosyltransferase [Actinidia rufa]|uniref:Glycosyltransferase n=1 Tax=Actinidia rufa TaxID=165716 RepID=A0A7J0G421_9ERIC|nr:glycosyltransferase [Actinidia rufa]